MLILELTAVCRARGCGLGVLSPVCLQRHSSCDVCIDVSYRRQMLRTARDCLLVDFAEPIVELP
jgi:hypothetical protein